MGLMLGLIEVVWMRVVVLMLGIQSQLFLLDKLVDSV